MEILELIISPIPYIISFIHFLLKVFKTLWHFVPKSVGLQNVNVDIYKYILGHLNVEAASSSRIQF